METRETLYGRNHLRCLQLRESAGDIAVIEAKLLLQTLPTSSEDVLYGRVDAFVGNKSLLDFRNNKRGRNISLNIPTTLLQQED